VKLKVTCHQLGFEERKEAETAHRHGVYVFPLYSIARVVVCVTSHAHQVCLGSVNLSQQKGYRRRRALNLQTRGPKT
jgi:hypothetical protein